MRPYYDAKVFLEGASAALRSTFRSFDDLGILLKRQTDEIQSIGAQKQKETFDFTSWGQWEDQANAYHANLMHRIQVSNTIITEIARKTGELRIQLDLTEECLTILAGTVLQIGKQVISFRFGKSKTDIPSGLRLVGSQSIGDVVWEARNNALHWEDGTPHKPVVAMFSRLAADFPIFKFDVSKNCARQVLDTLGWNTAAKAEADLEAIIQ